MAIYERCKLGKGTGKMDRFKLANIETFLVAAALTFAITVLTPTVVSVAVDNQNTAGNHVDVYEKVGQASGTWLVKAVEPQVLIPLLIGIFSGIYWLFRKGEEERHELGRLQFLSTVTDKIETVIEEKVTPKLENIEFKLGLVQDENSTQQVRLHELEVGYSSVANKITYIERSLEQYFGRMDAELNLALSRMGSGPDIRIVRSR